VTSLLRRRGFLLSNPFPGADGASPSNFWMRSRSAFRNPFRVPLRTGAGLVPRIHMFWTRRAPWFFALKPLPRRRRSVALQLLDGGAVCLSKPVSGSATNGFGVGPAYSHVLDSKGAMDFLLSNPSPGADGASPSNFWMGTRSAFRNPFRVPLRTGLGILRFDSVRDGGGAPLPQPGEAGNSVEMGVARIEDERVLDGESGDPEVVRGDRRAVFF